MLINYLGLINLINRLIKQTKKCSLTINFN